MNNLNINEKVDFKNLINIKTMTVLLMIVISVIIIIAVPKDINTKISYEELTGFYFDTYISVKLYYNDKDSYNKIIKDANQTDKEYFTEKLNDINKMCANYHNLWDKNNPESDIYKINTLRNTAVDEETYKIIEKSVEYSSLTKGAFDITLGTVTTGFNASEKKIYNEEKISGLLDDISYKSIKLYTFSESGKTTYYVELLSEETLIDLGSIAKGYIADEISSYLKASGINNALISLGGNIIAAGSKSQNVPYIIGVQKPFDPAGSNIATLKINDYSVVTSGIYERYFEADGKLLHHIFSPKTGMPVENNLYSVTVIGKDSDMCDMLSTALFVMGISDGIKLINSLEDYHCIYIDNEFKYTYSNELELENGVFSIK
ncbi:MAG: FAD:protein FMN transferase [Lachnospiraceae bacterium]|nr:FAD:protein FMN transferase [Lachnospiraceae bacterium]